MIGKRDSKEKWKNLKTDRTSNCSNRDFKKNLPNDRLKRLKIAMELMEKYPKTLLFHTLEIKKSTFYRYVKKHKTLMVKPQIRKKKEN